MAPAMILAQRSASKQDECVVHNHHVYAGWVSVPARKGVTWVHGLVAQGDITKGTIVAQYTGKVMSKMDARKSNSEYLMLATSTGKKRTVVIDGHPRHGGIGGYANYAPWAVANTMFLDELHEKLTSEPQYEGTFVLLVAKHDIPAGQELRIDYDTASNGEFRKQLISRYKIDEADLDSNSYLSRKWPTPSCLGRFFDSPTGKIRDFEGAVRKVGMMRPHKRKPGRPPKGMAFVQY